MKKIFCDCCEKEFTYQPTLVMGKQMSVAFPRGISFTGMRPIEVEIDVIIKPVNVPNGEHVDICQSCRWLMLDRFDPRTVIGEGL